MIAWGTQFINYQQDFEKPKNLMKRILKEFGAENFLLFILLCLSSISVIQYIYKAYKIAWYWREDFLVQSQNILPKVIDAEGYLLINQ